MKGPVDARQASAHEQFVQDLHAPIDVVQQSAVPVPDDIADHRAPCLPLRHDSCKPRSKKKGRYAEPMLPRSCFLSFFFGAIACGATAQAATGPCKPSRTTRVWFSPEQPVAGQPVYVMAIDEDVLPEDAALFINGQRVESAAGRFWRAFQIEKAPAGVRVEVRTADATVTCRQARSVPRATIRAQPRTHWQTRRSWDAAYESYFSAWLERLFMAAPDASLDFRPLAEALWDPSRNHLFNHLQLEEDDRRRRSSIKAAPDCADLPYVLRAYFAWKHELPFGFRECDRGSKDRAPLCETLHTNEEPSAAKDPVGAFKSFLRLLVNKVHSGSLRTALADEQTDFYPVPLTREALRAGTIFADPYGHVLMVASWVDRPGQPGLLFAVDGQPDASIARKRFWEGNFLYANDVASAGAGFKAFRPLVPRAAEASGSAALVPLTNAELQRRPGQPFSAEQAGMDAERFYARMFQLINPGGLPASTAYDDVLAALVEQLEARVRSVENGEQHMRETKNQVVDMPAGPRIFETVGPWEDFATPSRDMRLLIATRVLEALPERITRHPELFALEGKTPTQAREDLEARHRKLTREKQITYRNSEGKPVELTVAEILSRRKALEMAYNPNDCVEIRWGAPEGSAERASCRRRAPEEQRQRMEENRVWFSSMRRPSRE